MGDERDRLHIRGVAAMFVLAACCDSESAQSGDTQRTAPTVQDAATTQPDTADPSARVSAALMALDRVAKLKCPCLVAAGGFQSARECEEKTGYDAEHIACLSGAFAALDDVDNARAALRCQQEQAQDTAECLEERGCEPDAIGTCYEDAQTCPMYDPGLLTQVLQRCPDATVLSR